MWKQADHYSFTVTLKKKTYRLFSVVRHFQHLCYEYKINILYFAQILPCLHFLKWIKRCIHCNVFTRCIPLALSLPNLCYRYIASKPLVKITLITVKCKMIHPLIRWAPPCFPYSPLLSLEANQVSLVYSSSVEGGKKLTMAFSVHSPDRWPYQNLYEVVWSALHTLRLSQNCVWTPQVN